MKLFASVGIFCLALFLVGCSGQSPEDVARDYIKSKIKIDDSVKLDVSKLSYKKLKSDPDKVIVEVSGKVDCKGKLVLVKKDGDWIIK